MLLAVLCGKVVHFPQIPIRKCKQKEWLQQTYEGPCGHNRLEKWPNFALFWNEIDGSYVTVFLIAGGVKNRPNLETRPSAWQILCCLACSHLTRWTHDCDLAEFIPPTFEGSRSRRSTAGVCKLYWVKFKATWGQKKKVSVQQASAHA